MKVFLTIAILTSLTLTGVFAFLHSAFEEPKISKALKQAFAEPAEKKQAKAQGKKRKDNIPPIAVLWKSNLFDPSRGEVGAETGKPLPPPAKEADMELIGICKYGDTAGAIIACSNRRAPQRVNPRNRRYGGKTRRLNVATRPPASHAKNSGARKKRYYRKGQRLDNGYVLSVINSDSVVLSRGGDERVLNLKFGDVASVLRQANGAENSKKINSSPEKKKNPLEQKQTPDKKPVKRVRGLPRPPAPPPMMKTASLDGDGNFNEHIQKNRNVLWR